MNTFKKLENIFGIEKKRRCKIFQQKSNQSVAKTTKQWKNLPPINSHIIFFSKIPLLATSKYASRLSTRRQHLITPSKRTSGEKQYSCLDIDKNLPTAMMG